MTNPGDTEPLILVVDDDQRLRTLIKRFLTDQGFRVTVAADAAEARTLMASLVIDAVVLDVMMPGESGLDLLVWIKAELGIPVILLTARGEAADRIGGLERGADDYLAKPFEPRELVLRLLNLTRRPRPAPAPSGPRKTALIRFGDLVFDHERNLLIRNAETIHLTQSESQLLAAFCQRPGAVLTRQDLHDLGIPLGQGRLIDVQVTRLRRKIEPDPHYPRYLQTVRGRGYVFRPD